jgi:hypothetical protein
MTTRTMHNTLKAITLLCDSDGRPEDGPRFRELIHQARTLLHEPDNMSTHLQSVVARPWGQVVMEHMHPHRRKHDA